MNFTLPGQSPDPLAPHLTLPVSRVHRVGLGQILCNITLVSAPRSVNLSQEKKV